MFVASFTSSGPFIGLTFARSVTGRTCGGTFGAPTEAVPAGDGVGFRRAEGARRLVRGAAVTVKVALIGSGISASTLLGSR